MFGGGGLGFGYVWRRWFGVWLCLEAVAWGLAMFGGGGLGFGYGWRR